MAVYGFPVAVTFPVLEVAPSADHEVIKRGPSARELEDGELTALIVEVHEDSRSNSA